MKTEIRQEKKDDRSSVYEVNEISFGRDSEAKLVDALRKNKEAFIPGLSIIAIVDNEIVGHILFTKIEIINNRGEAHESLALAPMAVKPGYQKKGIGGQLIQSGLEKAKALGYTSVIVVGHEHYYPRFGFVPAEKWNIKAPFEVPAIVFMGMELVKDGLKGIEGTVKYPKEFEEV